MTLDEAIKHAEEKARDANACEACRKDHEQLATWLKELKACKELLRESKEWFKALDPDIENTPGELGDLVKRMIDLFSTTNQ